MRAALLCLLVLAAARLGEVPAAVRARIEMAAEEQLLAWIASVGAAPDVEAALAALSRS